MNINWSLLGPPVDIGGRFQEGLQHGRAVRQQGVQDNALAALGQDPTNQSALAALMSVDPRMGMQFQQAAAQRAEAERASVLRQGLTGAYDPATGRVDPLKARQAYLGAGDVQGAMDFDASQTKQQDAQLEQHRERITYGANIIQQVKPTDDAGWQRVLGTMKQAGYEVSDVPQTFDPAYADSVVQAARGFAKSQAPRTPVVIDGVAFDPATGQPLFESPYNKVVSGPGGIYEQPRIGIGRGGTGAPVAGRIVEGGGLPAGWTVVDDEDEGGAGSQAPRTFP